MKRISKVAFSAVLLSVGVAGATTIFSRTVCASASDTSINIACPADIGSFYESSSTSTTIHSFTKAGVGFAVTGAKTKSSSTSTTDYSYLMLMSGQIYNTNTLTGQYIKSVSVTFTSTTGTSGQILVSFGSTAISTRATTGGTAPTKGGTLTLNNADTSNSYFNISNTTTSNTQISSLSITFASATSQSVTLSSTSINPILGGSEVVVTSSTTNFGSETPTYSIETGYDASVATPTINATTGVLNVAAKGYGTTSITVKATSTSYSATAVLACTVYGKTYTKITAVDSLKVGTVVSFATGTGKAMSSTASGSTFTATDAAVNGDALNPLSSNVAFYKVGIGSAKDTYTFLNTVSEKYLYATGASYGLSEQTPNDAKGEWTLTMNTAGNITMTSTGATSYNVFDYYSSNSVFEGNSSRGSTAIYLFADTANAGDVDSISISTVGKTSYSEGDTFDSSSYVVEALFADGDTTVADVSKWITWSPTTIVSSTTTVTGTFAFAGVTKTVNQAVTVTAKVLTSISIAANPTKTEYVVGDTFDSTGLDVEATYEGAGSTSNVTSFCALDPANGSALSTAGQIPVTVTYSGKTASFTINVSKAAVSDIASAFAATAETVASYSQAITSKGNRWTLNFASTAKAKVYDATSGFQQIGTSNNPVNSMTIQSGNFVAETGETKVTKVIFTAKGASTTSAATLAVTVGGTAFSASNTALSGNTEQTFTFNNTDGAYGKIAISFTSVAKGIFLGSIQVFADTSTTEDSLAVAFAHKVELANGCATDSTTYSALKAEYDGLTAAVQTKANAIVIDDFDNASTTNITLNRCTVEQKLAAMAARAGTSSPANPLIKVDTPSDYLLPIFGSFALLAAAGFFLLKKKEQH
jgi:hypothetical protein